VALGALSISACGGVANSSTRADGHVTVRLAYDASTERTVALGTTITLDVEPIDGQTPEVRVCGIYGATGPLTPTRDPMPGADAVLKPVGSRPATYRAVSVGKVRLCGVPAQAVAKCRPHPCHDLVGDEKPMITVTVGRK